MSLLYKKQSLSELDIRLRYFLCSEIEAIIQKLYPNADAQLFGSSVNGFGRFDCDLDIVLDLWNGRRSMVSLLTNLSYTVCDNIRFFLFLY